MALPRGLYDLLLTQSINETLEGESTWTEVLSDDDAPSRLADALRDQISRLLEELEIDPTSPKALQQARLVNGLLQHVRGLKAKAEDLVDPLVEPPAVLRGVGLRDQVEAPATGLWSPWLFTAGRGSPSLLTELRREAAACDEIDILVSFITKSGVRKVIDILRSITAADATGRGRTQLRVLTTTYMGATEIAALDELAGLNGCEVRISLDPRRSRLHAKAWIFKRHSGFGSAYIGSANLSGAALLGGVEWTVKITQRGQENLFTRAIAHFDTLWHDPEFQTYKPDDEELRASVQKVLNRERGESVGVSVGFFDIQPRPFQQEMLADLEAARRHGRHRNLVVAATGTGKTVVAALDYRRQCKALGHRPRLLFVAHRAQILRQALRTFREVLRDHSFGEILSGGVTLTQHEYLFATIDSLTSRDLVARLGSAYWHHVIIDECHRIAANRFDRLARALDPAEFVGLTATPERTDGQPLTPYFDFRADGTPTVELRLWEALDMQLLTPFEYYAADDDTDFSDVPWDSAGETAAISERVTGNAVRARLVVDEWNRLSTSPRDSKALVFCVTVEHARFMAQYLADAGLPAECVVGTSTPHERLRALRKLASGEVCALVTVDLYNEGVDIPDVDTLLLLRPTQSALLFQQQIGRGLRLHKGKDSCLILDFVGNYGVDFRFDRLFGAITGMSRSELIEAVERGFSRLPPGCHIHLQPKAREKVLGSLRTLTNQSWRRLGNELQMYMVARGRENVTLGMFLRDQRVALEDIYRERIPAGWTTLRRAAGLLQGAGDDTEATLSRKFGNLLHVDDPDRLGLAMRVAERRGVYFAENEVEALRLQMLAYQVETPREPMSYEAFLKKLASYPHCADELGELAAVLESRTTIEPTRIPGLEDLPLVLHASYTRREILTAVGRQTAEVIAFQREGVLLLNERSTELLLVTLDKSKGFHDRISYHDYAVSPTRFHWQTQNSAGPRTKAGRRYLESPENGWRFQLFVRPKPGDAFRACGPVYIADRGDVRGDRPMSIEWSLVTPLPPGLFGEFSVLRGA